MNAARGGRIARSRSDRIIAGVCGGLAAHFGWSPDRLRAAYVVVSILSAAFPGMLVYLVLWYLMPGGSRVE
jgi:phage shock protein C